jgi:xanthine dehydrogenase accessory factor
MPDDTNKTQSREVTNAVRDVLDRGGTGVLITLIAGMPSVGLKRFVAAGGQAIGSLGDPELDQAASTFAAEFLKAREEVRSYLVEEFAPDLMPQSNAQLLFERLQPEPRIVICGAGHVGAALARLGSLIGHRITLIDDRADFLTLAQFPSETITLVVATDWATAVREAIGNGRGVSVAVVTRGHNEDEECLRSVMTTNPDYVGLIGSKRRTRIVLDRLRQAGAEEGKLARVHAPIGLDIGAVTPEEVALAILAEMIGARRGGKGGSLSAQQEK